MSNTVGLFSRLKNIIIPKTVSHQQKQTEVTNNAILEELVECFKISCKRESVGGSLLFNSFFYIILHPDVYKLRLSSMPVIVKEAVKAFYTHLKKIKPDYEELSPISASWSFKFGPGAAFNQQEITIGDIRVIGMLTGTKEVSPEQKSFTTAKVTMRSKLTNVFDRLDINPEAFREIFFRDSGGFVIKFNPLLVYESTHSTNISLLAATQTASIPKNYNLAEIECFLGDQNMQQTYIMKDTEIVVARKEPENTGYSNYLLVDSKYISNPHIRLRYSAEDNTFQLASFSRYETRVNEQLISKSDFNNPQWTNITGNAQILLNSIVTLRFKSLV